MKKAYDRRQSNQIALRQLESLLERNPHELNLDMDGLIIDYLGRSGKKLEDIFKLNGFLYGYLFGEDADRGRRLVEALGDPDVIERCKKTYPLVATAFAPRTDTDIQSIIRDPGAYLGYQVRSVIWHISDIHFGKFYKLKENPRELAFFLAQLSRDYPALFPDQVVISGDVSSVGDQAEFDQFRKFCEDLSFALWNKPCPERILMVPGNHDVTWKNDGTADQMAMFSRNFCTDEVCVTPFGQPERLMGDGRFKITRKNPHPETSPPLAVIFDQLKKVKLVLLVSGYFSGMVPQQVRERLACATGSSEDLLALLRADEGEVSHEYLSNISDALTDTKSFGIGIIHHNPVSYGVEMSRNPLAPKLLDMLWLRGIPILLHGHIHMSESRSNKRPGFPGQCYPIPVSTLASVTTAGGARGMNIHFIGPDQPEQRFDTLVWTISQSMAFRLEDAAWRYRIRVKPDRCEVEHL